LVDEEVRLNPHTGKPEMVMSVFNKLKLVSDAAYECPHRVMTYKLRADEGDVYCLPHPLCADCRREMTLTLLWGESMDKERPTLFRDEKEA